MKDVFRSGDSSKKFKIAEGQWYRYAPSYVSPAYHLLEGFPFIQEPPSGDLQERVLIRHHRSEERRVGKECRSRGGPQPEKKKEARGGPSLQAIRPLQVPQGVRPSRARGTRAPYVSVRL